MLGYLFVVSSVSSAVRLADDPTLALAGLVSCDTCCETHLLQAGMQLLVICGCCIKPPAHWQALCTLASHCTTCLEQQKMTVTQQPTFHFKVNLREPSGQLQLKLP